MMGDIEINNNTANNTNNTYTLSPIDEIYKIETMNVNEMI